jgi:hypothetical protein
MIKNLPVSIFSLKELKPLVTVYELELTNEYLSVKEGEVVITVSAKLKHFSSKLECLILWYDVIGRSLN